MILARCPACATTFRVRPEQLRARQGRVRCGHCQHAFNALETLVENPVPPPPASVDGEPLAEAVESPVFILEEKSVRARHDWTAPDPDSPSPHIEPIGEIPPLPDDAPAEPELLDAADEPTSQTPAFDAAPLADPFPDGSTHTLPERLDDAPPVEPTFILDDPPARHGDGPPDEHLLPLDVDERGAEIARATEPAPIESARDDGASTEPPPAAAFPLPPDFGAPPNDVRLEPEPGAAPDPAPKPFTLVADADDAPFVLPAPQAGPDTSAADDEDAPPRGLRQAVWAAAVTFLIVALLAQGVLVFRNRIALAAPALRPALEALCDRIGCDMPLPRDSSLITIESSDMQPDGSREARFTLYATLRNRADFEQAYPYLEITLTDARDKALVRRVLEPAQWLPPDARKAAFAPNQEISARIVFDAPGVAAAGYQVLAFHP
ncbi:MAG TPA: DUF3426 domain-containing protein [Rhodocyclaceae bacterium]|nr:DUF3426 domain-containing protein [Rhodocyclaceae bacterium]HNA67467.1 DUF3426 domain-containing protein [Rhodocyclaceae bacterium]